MGKAIKEALALDSNKWIQLVEEIEDKQNAEKWKKYIEENNFEIIVPDLVLKEIIGLLAHKEKTEIWAKSRKLFIRLMKSGRLFDFKDIEAKHELNYYYICADMLIKKYKIKAILKIAGLCKLKNGQEKYALHREDLAIFVSLKELGRPYYFLTHDEGIKAALRIECIRSALISEGLHFVLIHETQNPANRRFTRIKVMPEA